MTAVSDPPDPGPRPVDEEELCRRLRRGDREAAAALAEATYRRTYASLYRWTNGDAELAADLTQDAYRRAWAALDSFEGRARFSTWLYRIAYTTFLNHVRGPRRTEPLEEATLATLADGSPPADVDVGRRRLAARLHRLVRELPEDLRFAVSAHYFAEVPVREIAEEVGITTVGVRKRIRRGLERLAAALEDTR